MAGQERLSRGRDGRAPAPQITTAMVALAWSVLHSSEEVARETARVLAQKVLDASETGRGEP